MVLKGYEIIKNKRIEKGISQRELARKIGVDNATLLKIENGKTKKPNIKIMFKICKELNMEFEDEYRIYEFYEYDFEELKKVGFISDYIVNEKLKNMNSYLVRINDEMQVFDLIKLFEDYKKNKLDLNTLFYYILIITDVDLNNYIYKFNKKNSN